MIKVVPKVEAVVVLDQDLQSVSRTLWLHYYTVQYGDSRVCLTELVDEQSTIDPAFGARFAWGPGTWSSYCVVLSRDQTRL